LLEKAKLGFDHHGITFAHFQVDLHVRTGGECEAASEWAHSAPDTGGTIDEKTE
jgi:hypothetical protein